MNKSLREILNKLRIDKSNRRVWKNAVLFCAAIVVFCTTYALILPAITWDQTLICEIPEHTHSSDCYEITDGTEMLVCTIEEHVHDETCFDAPPADVPIYLCGCAEHMHSDFDDCFYSDGTLKCTLQEHVHSDECLVNELGLETVDIEIVKDSKLLDGEFREEDKDTLDETDSDLGPLTLMPFDLMVLADDENNVIQPAIVNSNEMANEWQVVSGRYKGTTNETKIIKDSDGNVLRLRKNVIPAGVENEFYIYMTVEPVFYHNWVDIFKASGMLVNNSNNSDSYYDYSFSNTTNVNDIVNALGINSISSLMIPDDIPMTNAHTMHTGKEVYIGTINLTKPDGTYIVINDCHLVYSLPQNSTTSFTIIYSAPNSNHAVKLSNIDWDGVGRAKGNKHDYGTLTFPKEAYEALIEANAHVFDKVIQRSFPEKVVDPMGEHIEFIEIVEASTGSATYADGKITWDLSNTTVEPSQDPADYEQINADDAFSRTGAYQLVYKIRLDVSDEGFHSAAAQMTTTSGQTVNPTNGQTTVTYHTNIHPNDKRSADFNVPAVRGLLYDVSFRKVDQYNMGVPGAVFTLYNSKNEVVDTITTTSVNQLYIFKNLTWDTYTLTESIPENYSAQKDEMIGSMSWNIPLCYTTDRDVLTPDTGQLVGNMVYSGSGELPFEAGGLKIINYKFTKEFIFKKISPEGIPLSGAQFKLYYDKELTREVEASLHASGVDGVFTSAGFTLPKGTYYVVETVIPDGFIRPSVNGVLTVYEKGNGFKLFWNGVNYESRKTVDGYHTIYSAELVNNPSIPLPETGGRGNMPIVVAGITVLALTWSYFYMVTKRR